MPFRYTAPTMARSRVPGFYQWPIEKRRATLAALIGRPESELSALDPGALDLDVADQLIENVIGVLGLPVGLGLNLTVNGEDLLIPMAVEESSVVAAFSNAAKIGRSGGGFRSEADPSHMIGQMLLSAGTDAEADSAIAALEKDRDEIEAVARNAATAMRARGGGLVRIEHRKIDDPEGEPPFVVVHIILDVLDAMGANVVNRVTEAVAPTVGRVTGLEASLRIVSNLATHRLARASVSIPVDALGGPDVARRISEADRFARLDPHRAATHNKGMLNGIDAVAIATGNDWRSIEAGAHAWAARDGQYRGLTKWTVADGRLDGFTELPMAVGTVGGITHSHPTIKLLRSILGARDARHLAAIFAAVGLAQNLAALRALAAEGIQKGHMALHARQLALASSSSSE